MEYLDLGFEILLDHPWVLLLLKGMYNNLNLDDLKRFLNFLNKFVLKDF